jgi:hypothetical protein
MPLARRKRFSGPIIVAVCSLFSLPAHTITSIHLCNPSQSKKKSSHRRDQPPEYRPENWVNYFKGVFFELRERREVVFEAMRFSRGRSRHRKFNFITTPKIPAVVRALWRLHKIEILTKHSNSNPASKARRRVKCAMRVARGRKNAQGYL